jgi:hypothetical protein
LFAFNHQKSEASRVFGSRIEDLAVWALVDLNSPRECINLHVTLRPSRQRSSAAMIDVYVWKSGTIAFALNLVQNYCMGYDFSAKKAWRPCSTCVVDLGDELVAMELLIQRGSFS